MTVLVTGAAGFIGSTLVERLLSDGREVVGVDSFTDYYSADVKRANIARSLASPRFRLREEDLVVADCIDLVAGADAVIHLAGQPGVRLSWREHFSTYLDRNVVTTQRLLEALREKPEIPFLLASSSSVYGDAAAYPSRESDVLRPRSPYGVTKAAAESLTYSYSATHGLRAVAMRFFTVYGPRQRPDMATHRLIDAALRGTPFTLFGDGSQLRDFTYVDDICRAIATLVDGREIPVGFTPINLGGDGSTSMRELIQIVEEETGRSIDLRQESAQPGDVRQTGADVSLAADWLGWRPEVGVRDGVRGHVEALRASVHPLTN